MSRIPDSRKTVDELAAMSRARPARGIAPQAAHARQPTTRDLPLSVGDWLLTIIVLAIPGLNLILYIYWAIFSNGNQSRINFCRASLILAAVATFIVLVSGAVAGI